jgi:hypothetical protein
VNDIADVMQTPARPASTPERTNNVVIKTMSAPRESNRISSQRLVIHHEYIICEHFSAYLACGTWTRTNLNSEVDHAVEVVEEARLRRKCADSNDALEKLAKSGEERGTCRCLHPAQVASRAQVADGEAVVYVPNDGGRKQKPWEDKPAGQG